MSVQKSLRSQYLMENLQDGPLRDHRIYLMLSTKQLFLVLQYNRKLFTEINRLDFDAFQVTRDAMNKATQLWESVCNVNFKEVQANEDPLFVVRYLDYTGLPVKDPDFRRGDNGGYSGVVAAAFFPYENPPRFVNVYPMFFDPDSDSSAVLLHELGHSLGFRHEHIWNAKQLHDLDPQHQNYEGVQERLSKQIDGVDGLLDGKRLQKFIDEFSIMYYPQFRLKSDNNAQLEFKLSDADKAGAALIYGMSASLSLNFNS